jgi:hypothetical protein
MELKKYTVHRIELIHCVSDVMADTPLDAIPRADNKDNWDQIDDTADIRQLYHEDRQEVWDDSGCLLVTSGDEIIEYRRT